MNTFISEYSTRWAFYEGELLNPHLLKARMSIHGVYIHKSDFCEIDEVLQEQRDAIKIKAAAGGNIMPELEKYLSLEDKVRQYMKDEIYRMRTGRDVVRHDLTR
jgi:hypothetical protein